MAVSNVNSNVSNYYVTQSNAIKTTKSVTNSDDNDQKTKELSYDSVEISEEGKKLAEQQSAKLTAPVQAAATTTEPKPANGQTGTRIFTENFSSKTETKSFNLLVNGTTNIKVSYKVFKDMTAKEYEQALDDGLKAAGLEGKLKIEGSSGDGKNSISFMNEKDNPDFYVIDNLDVGNRPAGTKSVWNGLAFGNWKRDDCQDLVKSELGYYYDKETDKAVLVKDDAPSVDMSKIFNTTYAIDIGDDGTASFKKGETIQSFSLKINGDKNPVVIKYNVKENMSARELSNSINIGIKNAGILDGFMTRINGNSLEFGNDQYNSNFYILSMFSMGTTRFGSTTIPIGLGQPTLIGNIINEKAEPFLFDAYKTIKDKFLAGDYEDYHGGF